MKKINLELNKEELELIVLSLLASPNEHQIVHILASKIVKALRHNKDD
jgi:hypothetical protein